MKDEQLLIFEFKTLLTLMQMYVLKHKIIAQKSVSVIVSWVYLSNCRERSPSGVANSRAAGKEIPRLGWRPNVHNRVHKSLPAVSKNLSQVRVPV
jgi:hypothetical protein